MGYFTRPHLQPVIFVDVATVLFSAPFETSALLSTARIFSSTINPLLLLGDMHHLAVISGESWKTSTLVDTSTLTSIETRNYTFAELTVGSVPSGLTLTRVLLYTLAIILARSLTDSSFTTPSLEPSRTVTDPRRGTSSTIHTLRITDSVVTSLPLPARPTDTPTSLVTVSMVTTQSVTTGVYPNPDTLLPDDNKDDISHIVYKCSHPPQSQFQRCPCQLSSPGQ